MSTQMILDNDAASLWFHSDTRIIHHKFKKFVRGDDIRNVLDAGYEALKANGAQKWLSDDRNNSAIPAEDEEWAKTNWFPRVVAAGWKYWAICLPEKVVGQMNMKRYAEAYKEAGITANFFSDPDVALKWLEAQ